MNTTSYVRYLEAKRTVDERSINQYVWSEFIKRLSQGGSSESFHIMEIGAGTGNTFFKILETVKLERYAYSIVEVEHDHVVKLVDKLVKWIEARGGKINKIGDNEYAVQVKEQIIEVQIITEEIEVFLNSGLKEPIYDAIIGQAILDLLDIGIIFPLMGCVLKKGGLYYFPISYDGMTTLLPEYNHELDVKIEAIYHASMERDGIDRSHTGRRVLMYMLECGLHIISAGSSDWIICPDNQGSYYGDEAYFLEHILGLVEKEMTASNQLDEKVIADWHSCRIRQLNNGDLVYIAHQLDILACSE